MRQVYNHLYLQCSDEVAPGSSRNALGFNQHGIAPSAFPEAEVLDVDDAGGVTNILAPDFAVFSDVTPADVGRFRVSVCNLQSNVDGTPSAQLLSLETVPLKAARGFRLRSPHVFRHQWCAVRLDGGTYFGDTCLVQFCNGRFLPVEQGVPRRLNRGGIENGVFDASPEITANACAALLGLAFTRDLIWRVVIHGGLGASISLPATPASAMRAFRNREPEETSGRRAALRNWVRAHYRKRAGEDDDAVKEIAVREHLRGRTPFRWLGLDCELVVSPFDVRRNDRLAAEKQLLIGR